MMPKTGAAFRISRTFTVLSSDYLSPLPKPRCRHLDSATKPDMNVSVHPAPQQRGVCHTYLGNQSLWLFSYRDNVDATVASCLSHPSLRPFWAGCDRLPSCPHP